jgi:arylsulfatase A-like enzyme
MLTRRQFTGGFAASAASGLRAQSAGKPNILFILADDLGYGDMGCYGQQQIQTPNIDRLAAEGMRFTSAYSGSTVCAPSRCALMTGKHTGHAFIRGNARVDLPANTATLPRLLKQAGYRTSLIGKWGLGSICGTGQPDKQGFDEWFGYLDQVHAHTYYPTELWDNGKEFFLPGNFGPGRTDYSHDLFTGRALQFIERQRPGSPFFLYLAYTIPHANNERGSQTGNGMDVPSDAPYGSRPWPQTEKNFAAMVTRLDRDVGRLLASLRTKGLERETLVVFTSDNGPHREGGHDPEFFKSGGPLRGIKRDLYEGGIRVPSIARWSGKIRAGAVSDVPWAFWDFLPTAAELAGVRAPRDIDGVSIASLLRGGEAPARGYFYWEFHEGGFSQAVREGHWKAVKRGPKIPIELYDLSADIGEKRDVASSNPDVVSRLTRIFREARTESAEFPVKETAG